MCAGLVAGLAAWLPATQAHACGGFFCDLVNNQPTPVDQTGENILFAIDEAAGTVEAHIQIQYTGDPLKFGWVIPVSAEPDFAVGSELLFTNLLAATVPTYSFTTARDCSDDDDRSLGCVAIALDGGFAGSGGVETDGSTEDSGGFEVVKREIVGPFEIVVLKGGSADEVWQWLDAAGYYQDPAAGPIMQEYLDEGFYFAAAKLLHGAGVEELQPIVMTYEGTTPCVPLRLTAIAAMPDMPVRVFGLGHSRYAPSTYRHVELNDVAIDWTTNASNYTEVVARALDAPMADGHGFVTEYAGGSNVVSREGIFSDRWDAETFVEAAPINAGVSVIDALALQGLVDCSFNPCSYNHPQLLPLLRTYLPAPPGIPEDLFYSDMAAYEDMIDLDAWSGPAFANALRERIIDPGRRAVDLLARWPYLSRLLTILSPEEMTVDPEFIQNPDLGDVSNLRQGVMQLPCAGSNRMRMPNGRGVLLDEFGNWPTFKDMPAAQRVEQIAPAGAPQVLQDFDAAIVASLKASNARFDYDDGDGVSCALRRGSWSAALGLGVVFVFAWRGRRRRPAA
ncbi:DUF2330 domain-containing protein [Nannocystis punicea]|uniref:DUF2330 domain-containing protein n=1 Tax=Nannocystis punicea TaxID=2995304 RepID=A0ABY7HJQ0_9BACT|nr:DUF2330 domain-containing protein [Nannocystis poenicansa]WAS99585.1 DUF2330 domain-containing protein [Nannocystis poenicansa]